MQSRLKMQFTGGRYPEVFVLAQIKVNFFWETIYKIEVAGGRDINAAKLLATDKLQAYVHSGFGEKGVIDL
jgi:hypothetical protein